MIKLGKTFKDTITGFEGVATAYTQYITGCNQILLQPPVKKDGGFEEACWFDEQRCEVQRVKAVELDNGKNPGFDKPAPKR